MAGRNLGDVVEMILMQGGTFEGGFDLRDEIGNPLDSTWRGRLEVRAAVGGELIATFEEGGDEGDLQITDSGHVLLSMISTVTASLTSTADSLGLNATHYVADIEVWRASNPTVRYKPEAPFQVFVRPEVTTT